jgi:hypothetical protein
MTDKLELYLSEKTFKFIQEVLETTRDIVLTKHQKVDDAINDSPCNELVKWAIGQNSIATKPLISCINNILNYNAPECTCNLITHNAVIVDGSKNLQILEVRSGG